MIVPPGPLRVMVAAKPVDVRKGMEGRAALVKEALKPDPFSGVISVFRAKRADRVLLVFRDGAGLGLDVKRLDEGKFRWPKIEDGVVRLTPAQFTALVEGGFPPKRLARTSSSARTPIICRSIGSARSPSAPGSTSIEGALPIGSDAPPLRFVRSRGACWLTSSAAPRSSVKGGRKVRRIGGRKVHRRSRMMTAPGAAAIRQASFTSVRPVGAASMRAVRSRASPKSGRSMATAPMPPSPSPAMRRSPPRR